MLKKIFLTLSILIIFCFLIIPVLAQPDLNNNLNAAGQGAQYNVNVNENTVPKIIGKVVATVLAFVSSIFMMMIVFSGLQWMTAGGNEEKITKARGRLMSSIIGVGITAAAYFITWLITTTLLN